MNNGRLLLIALGFGFFADALLRVTPWGANVFVVVLGGIGAAALLSRWSAIELTGEGKWLALASLFFACGLVWRDSPTLTTANALALLVTTALAVLTTRAGQVRRAGITQYAIGTAYVTVYAIVGLAPVLLRETPWRRLAGEGRGSIALATTRGVLLAVPPVVLFGALFAAADANFQRLIDDTFEMDLDDLLTRTALVGTYAWLLGGMLREMLVGPDRPRIWAEPRPRLKIGAIELGIVLGLLDLLFLTFVVLQLPYLFGGRALATDIGYSEFARRGFFELVWVVGLALPLLLFVHWLIPRDRRLTDRIYGGLAAGMVGLLLVIVASAAQRMQIYVADVGLTELRVQSSAMMVWLTLVLVWFVATVLRGQRGRFAFGALISAFLVIGALDVLNPDALVVNTNAAHGHLLDRGRVDQRSMASTSADAVPALAAALPSLPAAERAEIVRVLEQRYPAVEPDWRTFNWSRQQARGAVLSLQQ